MLQGKGTQMIGWSQQTFRNAAEDSGKKGRPPKRSETAQKLTLRQYWEERIPDFSSPSPFPWQEAKVKLVFSPPQRREWATQVAAGKY